MDTNQTTWPVRQLGLRVQDIARSTDYYTNLGFSIIRDEREQPNGGSVSLGVGTQEILHLRTLPEGRPRPPRTAGLFHFALLLTDESELGSFLQHCIDQHIPVSGASDHIVSQALYLTDPEGNGIEIYADRPRDRWLYREGQVAMDTLPLNTSNLLKQAQPFSGFSPQLCLGHMHLNVGNLERSMAFYQDLGMNLMAEYTGQADFLSWDGYHHHLGINIWSGRNAQPVEPDVYGLDFFTIQRSDLSPATLHDPDGMTVVVL